MNNQSSSPKSPNQILQSIRDIWRERDTRPKFVARRAGAAAIAAAVLATGAFILRDASKGDNLLVNNTATCSAPIIPSENGVSDTNIITAIKQTGHPSPISVEDSYNGISNPVVDGLTREANDLSENGATTIFVCAIGDAGLIPTSNGKIVAVNTLPDGPIINTSPNNGSVTINIPG